MKPDDIPQGVWDAASAAHRSTVMDPRKSAAEPIARAILAEREACASIIEKSPPLVQDGRVLRVANQSDYATAIRSRP